MEALVPCAFADAFPGADCVSVSAGCRAELLVRAVALAAPPLEPVAVDVAVPVVFTELVARAVAPPLVVAVEVAVAPSSQRDSARAPTPLAVALAVPFITTTMDWPFPIAIASYAEQS